MRPAGLRSPSSWRAISVRYHAPGRRTGERGRACVRRTSEPPSPAALAAGEHRHARAPTARFQPVSVTIVSGVAMQPLCGRGPIPVPERLGQRLLVGGLLAAPPTTPGAPGAPAPGRRSGTCRRPCREVGVQWRSQPSQHGTTHLPPAHRWRRPRGRDRRPGQPPALASERVQDDDPRSWADPPCLRHTTTGRRRRHRRPRDTVRSRLRSQLGKARCRRGFSTSNGRPATAA